MQIFNIAKKKYLFFLAYLSIFAPIFVYIKTIYHYALNIPRQDDYDAILLFILSYLKSPLLTKIKLLFAQQGEHRAVFSKIVILSHYYIFGNVNFRHLLFFDVLLLIGIYIIIIYFLKKCMPINWVLIAIPLSFGLFDLNNFENADFVSAGLFNYGIILLFLLNMLFYSVNANKLTILAALIQIICIYSGGNGIIASFFIVLYAFFLPYKKNFIISGLIFLIFSPLYFYHFTNSNSNYFTPNIAKAAIVFLNATGANFGEQFGLFAGLTIAIFFIFLIPINLKLRINKDYVPLICLTGFVMSSLGVMSFFRGKLYYLNINAAYSSRYLVYSHIFMIMLFAFYLMNRQNKRIVIAVMLFSVVLYALNYDNGKAGFETFYQTMKNEDYYYPLNEKEFAKRIVTETCLKKIYCIEQNR